MASRSTSRSTPLVPGDALRWCERVRRDPLTLVLDLESTLLPPVGGSGSVVLDPPAVSVFEALDRVAVQVLVVSSRPRTSVDALRRSGSKAWWLAERGAWKFDGVWTGPPPTPELDQLAVQLGGLTAAVERRSFSVHVKWSAPGSRDAVLRASEAWLEMHPLYVALDGADSLEVRHRSISRVAAVSWIRGRIPNAHVLAIGDDFADDDMFGGLREDEIGIAAYADVRRQSGRRPWLAGTAAVRAFLWWLVEARISSPAWMPPVCGA